MLSCNAGDVDVIEWTQSREHGNSLVHRQEAMIVYVMFAQCARDVCVNIEGIATL